MSSISAGPGDDNDNNEDNGDDGSLSAQAALTEHHTLTGWLICNRNVPLVVLEVRKSKVRAQQIQNLVHRWYLKRCPHIAIEQSSSLRSLHKKGTNSIYDNITLIS